MTTASFQILSKSSFNSRRIIEVVYSEMGFNSAVKQAVK
jgi:hypothetical protein